MDKDKISVMKSDLPEQKKNKNKKYSEFLNHSNYIFFLLKCLFNFVLPNNDNTALAMKKVLLVFLVIHF